ncbi:hypothetical protein EJF36_10280 [Bacillus sp. HMF5848]|uniref:hypothetical protein n=1 Tax=Bacillus sp. HMF5848 TaxID=2495421 RepID=UPI000F7692A5|nr:hypothetical protein [Bacillus sp. HMF5848]RSK27236.1 hypothetical protein EJF36_10280 [Bacillus sp. HMF5848]
MIYITVIIMTFVIRHIYKCYFPVQGLRCREITNKDNAVYIDVRDFQEAAKDPIPNAINIPVGYLKRHYKDIPLKNIHIVAGTDLEKNMGARILRQKGFQVENYTFANCHCKEKVAM